MARAYQKKPDAELKHRRGAGRKPFVATPEQRKMVQNMAALGMKQDEISMVVGIERTTLAKYFRPELDVAYLQANTTVRSNLFNLTKTNVRACEFWLTNRDDQNWAYKHNINVSGSLTVNERPDLSGLSRDELAILRQAAAIMRQAAQPVIDGQARQLAGPGQDDEEDQDAE